MKKLFLIKRSIKFFFQRMIRGWDDSDLWNLDYKLSKYILPRLIRFKKVCAHHPHELTMEQWLNHLDEMIWAFQWYVDEKAWKLNSNDIQQDLADGKRIDDAIKLFGKYFGNLWL